MKQQKRCLSSVIYCLLLSMLLPATAGYGQSTAYSIINTFAGGGISISSVDFNSRLATDGQGNILFGVGERLFKISPNGNISHIAGNGSAVYTEGAPAIANGLGVIRGVALDSANNIYLSLGGQRVVKLSGNPAIVTTVAGNGSNVSSGNGGSATAAGINEPFEIAIDRERNLLFIIEVEYAIRKVDLTTGIITAFAGNGANPGLSYTGDGGPATAATLGNTHRFMTIDSLGNIFFSSRFDNNNTRLLKVDAITGIITSIAGNGTSGYNGDSGPATMAALSNFITGMTVDGYGNLYFMDNHRIRKIAAGTGIITTIAGTGTYANSGDNGPALAAEIESVNSDLLIDPSNTYLYLSQVSQPRLRRINLATGIITSVLPSDGDGGPATSATLPAIVRDVAVAQDGTVYIADGIGRVRKVDPVTNIITTAAGTTVGFSGDNGPAISAQMNDPAGMALDGAGNLFIADRYNHRIRKVAAATGIITTVAGNGSSGVPVEGAVATTTSMPLPNDVVVDGAGNIYVSNAPSHAIYKISASTGIINKIAGTGVAGFSGDNGPALTAQLNSPHGILLDAAGNLVFCDKSNHRIRSINLATGIITTIAGSGVSGTYDAPASIASFNLPDDIAYDPAGNLIIADLGNNKMRMLSTDGNVYTVAGTGTAGFSGDGGQATAATLRQPDGMAIVPDGKTYIADQLNGRIRTFTSPVIVQPATVKLRLKVLLQGALLGNAPTEATLMRDNLRSSPSPSTPGAVFIPTVDPYSTEPLNNAFTEMADGLQLGYRTIASPTGMFADYGAASVVDWVFVELRDKNNPSTVLSTRSVLVRRNGLTVDALGDDTLRFPSLPAADQYYVSLRHRNHLGAMTAAALPSSTFDGSTLIDFSAMTDAQLWNSPGYDGLEQATIAPGTKALWAGNTNADVRVRFSGVGNDVGGIQSSVQNFSGNAAQSLTYTQAFGYLSGDVNMDSRARYSGIGNDPAWIQSLIQNYTSNPGQSLVYTGFLQQLP